MKRFSASWMRNVVLGVLVLVLAAEMSPEAHAIYRHRWGGAAAAQARARRLAMIASAQQQLAAGKELVAAAEAKGTDAQRRLDSAVTKLQAASRELRETKRTAWDLEKHLREIESQVLANQGEKSEYGRAAAELTAATKECQNLEASILGQPEAKAKLSRVGENEVAETRQAILGDNPEWNIARTKRETARKNVDAVRKRLLEANPDWVTTHETLREAHRETSTAERQATSAGASQLAPRGDLRKAENAKAAGLQAIAQAEATLQALHAAPQETTSGSNSSSPGSSAARKSKDQ